MSDVVFLQAHSLVCPLSFAAMPPFSRVRVWLYAVASVCTFEMQISAHMTSPTGGMRAAFNIAALSSLDNGQPNNNQSSVSAGAGISTTHNYMPARTVCHMYGGATQGPGVLEQNILPNSNIAVATIVVAECWACSNHSEHCFGYLSAQQQRVFGRKKLSTALQRGEERLYRCCHQCSSWWCGTITRNMFVLLQFWIFSVHNTNHPPTPNTGVATWGSYSSLSKHCSLSGRKSVDIVTSRQPPDSSVSMTILLPFRHHS